MTVGIFTMFGIHLKHRNHVILFLRTLIILIIPFLSSMFFINDCGNSWSYFWNNCSPKNKEKYFDIDLTIMSKAIHLNNNAFYPPRPFTFNHLLTPDEVCKAQVPSPQDISKCFVSFYYLWTNVLFESLFIMLFMPLLITFGKLMKNYIGYKCCKRRKNINLSIDSEYITIISSLEIYIVFSVFSPLMVPLIVCILRFNHYFYSLLIYKYKWKISFSYNNNLPVSYLYFAVFVENILSVFYLFYYRYSPDPSFGEYSAVLFGFIIFITYAIEIGLRRESSFIVKLLSKWNSNRKRKSDASNPVNQSLLLSNLNESTNKFENDSS
eukprot:272426_1